MTAVPRPLDDAERSRMPPLENPHAAHLHAGLAWLARAQDVSASGGISRGFSLVHHQYFQSRGWQPDYPETTGYIVPTFLAAAERLGREDFVARARLAATWECGLQLPDGAVRGGVVSEPVSPSVFNTGQVLLGWLSAFATLQDPRYENAARRSAMFLVHALDHDGIWRRGHSRFACAGDALYNARTAWALAATDALLGAPRTRQAAALALGTIADRQHVNGWFPDCCLTDPEQPLLHTIAYTVQGLLEGGRLLEDQRLIAAAARTSAALASLVGADGRMPGRLRSDWSASTGWSCLTGQAQMVTNWIRLFEITGDARWLEPVPAVLTFLKSTQDLDETAPGATGGIRGADPVSGEYAPNEVLSWATKFFVDALLRDERATARAPMPANHPLLFA